MILGACGLRYMIAARDHSRHWPIVLVGPRGKIRRPVGFVDAAMCGHRPCSMELTLLTSDSLWWIPFVMIRWHAAKEAHPTPPTGTGTAGLNVDGAMWPTERRV
ncbi:MAG: hypothetical protein ACOYN0_15920 [Phycisphaerales bacterium]